MNLIFKNRTLINADLADYRGQELLDRSKNGFYSCKHK